MADNIVLNPGAGGATLATDDVGGVQYQRIKQVFGADGVATNVAPDAGLPTAGQFFEATGSVSAINADIVASMDARPYRQWTLQLTGTFTAIAKVQGSNDNINWADLVGYPVSSTTNLPTASLNATGTWAGSTNCKYLRVRATTYSSGTVVGTLLLSSNSSPPPTTYVVGSSNALQVYGAGAPSDALSNSATGFTQFPHGYVGSAVWDRLRTPNVARTTTMTIAGQSNVWVPTAGRKFRLMRYKLTVTADAAMTPAGVQNLTFFDEAGAMPVSDSLYIPVAAVTSQMGAWSTGWCDLGNGILSAVTNNALKLNLSTALTSGQVRVQVCGIEE